MMALDETRIPFHRRVTLFQSDMQDNIDLDWTESASDVDWTTSAQYVILTNSGILTSVTTFRFGVLTFDFRTDDPTDIVVGFRLTANDYAYFAADQFQVSKHGEAATPKNMGIAVNTWYHAKILWAPEFVEFHIWNFNNIRRGYIKNRAASNRLMPIYFEVLAATGASLWIADVVLREGDDAEFFNERQWIERIFDV